MAQCKKCKALIPDESAYCMFCGKKLGNKSPKSRLGNGMGTATKRGKTWTARATIGWKIAEDGHKVQIRKTKGGFTSKKEALSYISTLLQPTLTAPQTLDEIYVRWSKQYANRISSVTMAGYKAAYGHFDRLRHIKVDRITANMLQECIDSCRNGKRTKQMMKIIAGLLMRYAIDDDQILKNPAANLYTGDDPTSTHEPISEEELDIIKRAFRTEPYAKYVYAMCYLGFRPTEFFSLTKESFHIKSGICYLCAGIKTDAGKDRPVTIPRKIQPIINEQLQLEGTRYLFPRIMPDGKYTHMTTDYFRKWVFTPMMGRLGIHGKVPYSSRHTYADKIKTAFGADRDKAALMGHTDYAITKKHYQSTSIEDRNRITKDL